MRLKNVVRRTLKIISNKPIFVHLKALVAGFVLTLQCARLSSFKEILDFSYGFRAVGVRISPVQVPWEIKKLLEIVSEAEPRTILEIGTANGGTLFLFTQVATPRAIITSLDLGNPSWKSIIYKRFKKHGQKLHIVLSDSHNEQTLNKVKTILKSEKLDFLFIDGDHSYEGVKRDFEMYAPLVKEGGIVAFHDVCPHPPQTGCEVNKLWNEIKGEYKHVEIVKDWRQGWAGIGVLYV